jgi:hypothetical protein
LFANTKPNTGEPKLDVPTIDFAKTKEILSFKQWNLKADSIFINDTALFDWRTYDKLKYSSAEGVYTTNFQWNYKNANTHIYLDLGKVSYTAEVFVNGKPAGKRIFSPYLIEISTLLQNGLNQLEVRVTTGQLNGFIGKAKQGDSKYKQFKNKEDQLMSAGLIGPVKIIE